MGRLASLALGFCATVACTGPTFTNLTASLDACHSEPGMSWQSLPPMRRTRDVDDVLAFFDSTLPPSDAADATLALQR